MIAGNIISLTFDGTSVLANQGDGINVTGSSGVTVGGSTASDRNIVSGNAGNGILLTLSATGNTIAGNYIGTDLHGVSAIGNAIGIQFDTAGTGNIVGTNGDGVGDSAEGNLISGNTVGGGLRIYQTPESQ